jgi:hypothetical protein
MRRLVVSALAALALAACGGQPRSNEPLPSCTAAPSPATSPSDLPPRFPSPAGVEYTSQETAGPSTILEGHWSDVTLEDAFAGWKDAFVEAGYQVTDEEREARDAEVNFAGGSSTGQVRLRVECADRIEVGITIRPGSS